MDFKFEKHLTFLEMEYCLFPTSSDFLPDTPLLCCFVDAMDMQRKDYNP